MKALKRGLKAFLITVLAYLVQVCVMKHLTFQGIQGSAVFAALAIIIVSCGKKYAFCASCLIGMMMECMLPLADVPSLYVIVYPAITMFGAQYFADMSDRKRENRRVNRERHSVMISEGKAKEHWWDRFVPRNRDTDLPPAIRIPLCAGLMDFLLNLVLAAYMYLIGVEIGMVHIFRLLISVLYTMALSIVLMVPLRYVLGMYRRRRKPQGGELL